MLTISLDEVTTSGLAAGTESYEKGAAYDAVRQVLSDMSAIDISGELLASCRYRLEKYLLLEQERPEYWINVLNLRYLAGKDFTTGAQERIKGVDADDVRRLLSSVGKNCKVEYIITGE